MKTSLWIVAVSAAGLMISAPHSTSAQYHSYQAKPQGASPFNASWHSRYDSGYYGSSYGYYGGSRNDGQRSYKSRDHYDRFDRTRRYYLYDDYGRYDRNFDDPRDRGRIYFQ